MSVQIILKMRGSSTTALVLLNIGGAKVQVTGHRTGHRSQVTGHRSQVTGHRSQVTMKNTCKFAASSYLVGICLFRPFLT